MGTTEKNRMPINNSKYIQEMRDETVKYILEKGIFDTKI
jgi:hypothetical protein